MSLNKTLFFLLIILTSFKSIDKKTYNEIPEKSYHPIVPGQVSNYIADLRKYKMLFDSSATEIQGKKYIKQTVDYGDSKSFTYYREENGMVLYIKPEQKQETVQIPANPTVGMIWYESDSTWKYTITGMNETFETPEAIFNSCLVIKSENIDRRMNPDHYSLYMQHYQRGRGYVGTKLGGLVYSYVLIK